MKYRLIFKAIVGSQAYGTSTPQSDVDYKGVYIQDSSEILGFKYKEQFEVGRDESYYEVRRFIQLLQTANPTVLELLYSPTDCVIESSPEFDLIVKHREKFLTKKCAKSFGGYAIQQIQKAKGLDKKMNWEQKRVERKTPFDFIYAYEDGKTIPIERYLKTNKMDQRFCGLTALNHFRDCYVLYYDYKAQYQEQGSRLYTQAGFHGLCSENGNDIRLSSIPEECKPECVIYYNKDGYSQHCKDFREYTTWLENRNTTRYVDLKNHNQQIDGKNLLHCVRLLDTAIEIATTGTINVRRQNADYLLSIRRGEVSLNDIITQSELRIKNMDELFEKSGLPDEPDFEFCNNLLLEVRGLTTGLGA